MKKEEPAKAEGAPTILFTGCWVHSADLEKDKGWDVIQGSDAILVPGGFGSRGIEGKILAARYAREQKCLISACAWACR